MPTVVALTLLLVSVSCRADDYLWFEGDWVPDIDAIVAANPQVQRLSPEMQEKFKGLFCGARWRLSDGMLIAEHGAESSLTSPYSIRRIDAGRFEMIVDGQGGEEIFEIRRTAGGFCATPNLDRFEVVGEPYVECYQRDGA